VRSKALPRSRSPLLHDFCHTVFVVECSWPKTCKHISIYHSNIPTLFVSSNISPFNTPTLTMSQHSALASAIPRILKPAQHSTHSPSSMPAGCWYPFQQYPFHSTQRSAIIPTTSQPCNPATLQPCNPATLRPATSQPRDLATSSLHRRNIITTSQHHNLATAQPRNRATAQPRNRATAQPRNRATAQQSKFVQ